MQDVIERTIVVHAPQETVYQAITDPAKIVKWFPDAVEGSFAVGERPIMRFGEEHVSQIYIEAVKPNDYFAYRWVPGDAGALGDVLKVPHTLVELHLSSIDEGTKVVLKESGFAALPVEVAQKSLDMNSGGWDYMMSRLEKNFA